MVGTHQDCSAQNDRARALNDFHRTVRTFIVDAKMTGDEFSTLLAGLLVDFTQTNQDIGGALGLTVSRVLDLWQRREMQRHIITNIKPQGSA